MNYTATTNMGEVVALALADGCVWDIIAANDRACDVVSALAKAMQLKPPENRTQNKFNYHSRRRLIVRVEDRKRDSARLFTAVHLAFEEENIICTLIANEHHGIPALLLVNLSKVICRDSQYRGGVLLHGALAEWNGNGVILAGPGGRGKTTASERLPHHWQSFCDDATLVMCDKNGVYWAHPWPTWSNFMFNGPGGMWDVQHAIPLKGIFFLEQAHVDGFESLGIAQSICLLNESAEQVGHFVSGYSEKNELRRLRLLRFNNICTLAQTVPSYVLSLGRNSAFWQEIERALNG
jgi:SynChlorMet cassette protein ScmC